MRSSQNCMATDWRACQEEAAEFFRSLGLDATVNARLQGVRTRHDVDVLVKSQHAGFEVTWIVECKHWNSPVSKLHVLALREIVTDLGADRGILLAESGFQSGAYEAAQLTNVYLTSLADAQRTASEEIYGMRLRELYDRVEVCKKQYWSISKYDRIECGLRPDILEGGYSGATVISLSEDLLQQGFRGKYPFETDRMFRYAIQDPPDTIDSAQTLCTLLDSVISDIESRIARCIQVLKKHKNAV